MRQNILEIEKQLNLLSINEITNFDNFNNEHAEYNVFLKEDSRQFEKLQISRTHVLTDIHTGDIFAYMSLVADSVPILITSRIARRLTLKR